MIRSVNLLLLLACLIFETKFASKFDRNIWIEAEDYLKEGFDDTVEPCQNFSNYACGKWFKSIGDKLTDPYHFQEIRIVERLNENLRKIDLTESRLPRFKEAARLNYDKCINNGVLNNTNLLMRNMYKILTSELGLIPSLKLFPLENRNVKTVNSSSVIDADNLWHKIAIIHTHLPAVKMFFKLTNENSMQDFNCNGEERGKLWFEPVGLDEVNVTELFRIFQLKKYVSFAENEKFRQLGQIHTALRDFTEDTSIQNENADALSEKSTGRTKLCPSEWKTMNIENLTNNKSSVPWASYLKSLLKHTEFLRSMNSRDIMFYIEKTDVILEKLNNLFSKFEPDIVFNYLFYSTLNASVHNLREEYKSSHDSLQIYCANETCKSFQEASARIAFDGLQYDATFWKNDILAMLKNLKAAFMFFIDSSDWLSSQDKVYLINHVEKFKLRGPMPSWFGNDTKINAITPHVNPNDSYIFILLKAARFNFELFVDHTFVGDEKGYLDLPTLGTYVAYVPSTSAIILQLGVALPPWYHPSYPLSVKYGSLGSIIGHEIMHGFQLKNKLSQPTEIVTHLKPETIKILEMKMKCIQKQYSAECYDEHRVCLNGVRTQNENKADVDGLKIAYMAYKMAAQTMPKEPKYSGNLYNLNSDQMFFLANSRIKCGTGKEVLRLFAKNDVHAPWQTRSDVPLKNFPVFASVFNCTSGSFYAPTSTCSILGEVIDGKKLKKFLKF